MRIGEYEILRPLGTGATGEVFEVENVRLGSRHALKLYACAAGDDAVRERFLVEGRLLARLDHPRVVKVTDVGTDAASGRPYFVMTLVTDPEGAVRSLAEVAPGSADEETIGRWYDDLREALAYVHAKGVIHRDLKLQNVLIGPDGHAVLTDFGISRILAPETVQGLDPVQTLVTLQNGRRPVMGSIGYLAPELELGAAATRESDWYALGVLVYRLLTGTWCEARTDVVAELETYDPVWTRLVPSLLHANPAGRACLGYAEESARLKAEDDHRTAAVWTARARRARLLAAGAVVAALLAGGGVGAALGGRAGSERLATLEERLALGDRDTLLARPAGLDEDAYENAREEAELQLGDSFSRAARGELSRDGFAAVVQALLATEDVRLDEDLTQLLRAVGTRLMSKEGR